MADDNTVEILFSAAADDVIEGIGEVQAALTQLTDPVRGLDGSARQMGNALAGSLSAEKFQPAIEGFGQVSAGAKDCVAQLRSINTEITLSQLRLAGQKIALNAEVSQFQITQNQKFALLEEETTKEYKAQMELLEQEAGIGGLKVAQQEAIQGRMRVLTEKYNNDILRLDEQAIAQQQQLWMSSLNVIEGAFNSQLRGLLAGTTSWSKAFKSMLGDIIIKFIEMCEEMVVKWAAAQLAQTTATTSGAAARAAAEQSAAGSGVLANAANALQAIMTDAAQTFAGVFAFLAPAMGPAAAGPAAAAQATVAAAAVFDVGTDYVLRGGLALIHQGETIVPARGSGPYTGGGQGAQVHAPVSINVSALDSQSVARFFNDNSRHMLRAINDAVKRGAHLGLGRAM